MYNNYFSYSEGWEKWILEQALQMLHDMILLKLKESNGINISDEMIQAYGRKVF